MDRCTNETKNVTTVEICRTQEDKFVGSAIMFGVDDLFFVDSNTDFLIVEKKKVGDALVVTISGGGIETTTPTLDTAKKLEDYPKFVEFVREQWEQHPDFWRAELRSAPPGIFRQLAFAVCKIGGGDATDKP